MIKTRHLEKDGGKYFGPYSDAGAVNRIVDLLNSTFSLKRCSTAVFPPGFKPCLNYHIRQCRGICGGNVDPEEYAESVQGALEFLTGRSKRLQTALKEKMQAAAEAMEYEEAAVYRDHLAAAEALSETQRVVLHHNSEADIVIPARGTEQTYMAVFYVRGGKLIGRESFELDASMSIEKGSAALVSAFLRQHYSRMPDVPKEILLTVELRDRQILEEYLSDLCGHHVSLLKAVRGEKRALTEMAKKDVLEMIRTIDERAESARERKRTLGQDIYNILHVMGAASVIEGSVDPQTGLPGYDGRQFRAEAYDISNTNGIDTVGAMVTFDGLKADRSGYRKFKIRTVQGQDDYACMQEVLTRRFARVFEGDEGFSVLPDIIFMDGGRGHVSCALEVTEAAGFDIPVVGMVKDDHHRTRALIYRKKGAKHDGSSESDFVEISLSDKPLLFSYIGRIQEEVHRFAIEYHRKVRGKRVEGSVLDEIPGIGPARRNALLEEFKSVDRIREIARSEDGEERLAQAPGMNRRAAAEVRRYFCGK